MQGIHPLPSPAPAPWLAAARPGSGTRLGLWGAVWPQHVPGWQDEPPALHTGTSSLCWAAACGDQKRSTASPHQPRALFAGGAPCQGLGWDRTGQERYGHSSGRAAVTAAGGFVACRHRAAPRVLSQRSALGRLWHGSILPLCVGSEGSWAAAVSRNYARPFDHNRFAQNSCININVPKDFEQLFGISRANI